MGRKGKGRMTYHPERRWSRPRWRPAEPKEQKRRKASGLIDERREESSNEDDSISTGPAAVMQVEVAGLDSETKRNVGCRTRG